MCLISKRCQLRAEPDILNSRRHLGNSWGYGETTALGAGRRGCAMMGRPAPIRSIVDHREVNSRGWAGDSASVHRFLPSYFKASSTAAARDQKLPHSWPGGGHGQVDLASGNAPHQRRSGLAAAALEGVKWGHARARFGRR